MKNLKRNSTKVKWFIEDFDETRTGLREAISKAGMTYVLTKYTPFEGGTYDHFDIDNNKAIVFQGSLNLGSQLQREKDWIPGVYWDKPKYECSYYYSYLGEHLLNADGYFLPYAEFKRNIDKIFKSMDECLFVRPNDGAKSFTGMVIHKFNLEEAIKLMEFYDIEPHKLVLVSEPKPILAEYRFIIVGDKVIAGSKYREGTPSRHKEEELNGGGPWAYAQDVLDKTNFRPDKVWVMDVCDIIPDAGVIERKVLEIGCFSCAGLYACNKDDIVREVSKAAEEEYSEFEKIILV